MSGKEHLDMLANMSNLASALSMQGKYDEAEVTFQELREKVLGMEHTKNAGEHEQPSICTLQAREVRRG